MRYLTTRCRHMHVFFLETFPQHSEDKPTVHTAVLLNMKHVCLSDSADMSAKKPKSRVSKGKETGESV